MNLLYTVGIFHQEMHKLSQYIAIAALLGQHGDELELFCSDSSDEGKFMHFLMENPSVQ